MKHGSSLIMSSTHYFRPDKYLTMKIVPKLKRFQYGQSMVEYTVVLVFGVMVLTTGPGGDVILELLDVLKNKYQGYSYAMSLSTPPVHDSLGEYLVDQDIIDPIDPNDLVDKINDYTSLPNLTDFAMDQLPDSPADILDGAISFF